MRKRYSANLSSFLAISLWIATLAKNVCHSFVHPLQRRRVLSFSNRNNAANADVLPKIINGDSIDDKLEEWKDEPSEKRHEPVMPFAPALTFDKYITMQEKRVVVTIRYSQGLKPFYLTVAKRIKEAHPDVLIQKRIMAPMDDQAGSGGDLTPAFEVLVDGKVVLPRGRSSRKRNSALLDSENYSDGRSSVFVSMYELEIAIAKARRKRRPSTLYGDEKSARAAAKRMQLMRKDDLKKGDEGEASNKESNN